VSQRASPPRKIIQIVPGSGSPLAVRGQLYTEERLCLALCDDGTVWSYTETSNGHRNWHQLPELPVPQPL